MSTASACAAAIKRVRQLMGDAVNDPETRRQASRETSSHPGAEIQVVQDAAGIEGSESVFRRMVKATSVGDLLDCTVELRYALVFNDLRFKVEIQSPRSVEMPDLLVSRDGESAYVEIRRIRPPHVESLPVPLRPPSAADGYTGPLESDRSQAAIKKIEDELRGKFRQARSVTSHSIIAAWIDRDFLEVSDFQRAMKNIRGSPTDPNDARPIPDRLLFCVFGWYWSSGNNGQQIYCEPLRELSKPFVTWMEELETARP